jgi:hypothetical protein
MSDIPEQKTVMVGGSKIRLIRHIPMPDHDDVGIGEGRRAYPGGPVRHRPLAELEELARQRSRMQHALAEIRDIHNRGDYSQTYADIGAVLDGLGDLLDG